MLRPRATLGRKRTMLARMPVAARVHRQAQLFRQPEITVERRNHGIASVDCELATRQEIVLHVLRQQCIASAQPDCHRRILHLCPKASATQSTRLEASEG